MFDLNKISSSQLDFFKELENIGVSHAATALSAVLDQKIRIEVPSVQFCDLGKVCDFLGGPENLVAGTLIGMKGDINGFILMVQDLPQAQLMSELATCLIEEKAEKSGCLSQMQISALMEIANILIGSYLTAISSLTGLTIKSTVPQLIIDMAGAIMNLPAAAYGDVSDTILFLETEFLDNDQRISGHIFLVPDLPSYDILLNKMEIV